MPNPDPGCRISFVGLRDREEPSEDDSVGPVHIRTDDANTGRHNAEEAPGEVIVGEVVDPDMPGRVREMLRRIGGGKTSPIDVIVAMVQASVEREVDTSGPRESFHLAKAVGLLRQCLIGCVELQSSISEPERKPRLAAERARARANEEELEMSINICSIAIEDLYRVARQRRVNPNIVEGVVIDVIEEEAV